jgi:hypothetical protein
MPYDLQSLLTQHQSFFHLPQGITLSQGTHDHSIPLVLDSFPSNVPSYYHPSAQKNKIENFFKELLEAGVIRPNTNPYSSPVFIVLKKEGTWHMCPDFCTVNKTTIK